MAITNEEIRIQLSQIQLDLSDCMGTIDETENTFLSTRLDELLKRKPHTRHTNDSIKHRQTDIKPFLLGPNHDITKPLHELIMTDWKLILDLQTSNGRRLRYRDDRLLHGSVDSCEVDDHVTFVEDQVAEHGVDTCRGILDEYTFIRRHIQDLGYCYASFVQGSGLFPADEGVRSSFGVLLEFPKCRTYLDGVCPEGA